MKWIEIHEAINGQYYVRVEAANGEAIAITETYVNKASARNAASLLQGGGGTIIDLS